jgi:hypothetical protein
MEWGEKVRWEACVSEEGCETVCYQLGTRDVVRDEFSWIMIDNKMLTGVCGDGFMRTAFPAIKAGRTELILTR